MTQEQMVEFKERLVDNRQVTLRAVEGGFVVSGGYSVERTFTGPDSPSDLKGVIGFWLHRAHSRNNVPDGPLVLPAPETEKTPADEG